MPSPPPLEPLGGPFPAVLPMRERAEVVDAITAHRLDTLLPDILEGCDVDLWLVICQEDNPDPLLPTLVPDKAWQPILTILAFFRTSTGVERFNLGMIDTADLYERPWKGPASDQSQWAILVDLVRRRDPKTIAINTGGVQWAAGGLTHHLYGTLVEHLPAEYRERLTSAEPVVSWWGSVMTPMEVPWFEHAVNVGRHVIAECYSNDVIEPGKTTTDDLKWHYLQRITDLGMEMSFTPYFHVIRDEPKYARGIAVERGDLVHCDVGIKYLRYHTDHQQWLYVCDSGQSAAPPEPVETMKRANRLQDIYLSSFEAGLTGNELLARMLERGRAAELNPKIYSHSLGYFLHEPGPLIGLPWEQERCPGRGDVVLRPYQAFTMELSVVDPLPQTGGKPFSFSIEEDVVFTPEGVRIMDERQTEFFLL